ncbi:MAG: hypothetical protein V1837_03515 [Candidatus Woesearchaeota archaeon]
MSKTKMNLEEHLYRLSHYYENLETNSNAEKFWKKKLVELKDTIRVYYAAKYGDVPTLKRQDLEGKTAVKLVMNYKTGRPAFTFDQIDHSSIARQEYFKIPTTEKDAAIKLVINLSINKVDDWPLPEVQNNDMYFFYEDKGERPKIIEEFRKFFDAVQDNKEYHLQNARQLPRSEREPLTTFCLEKVMNAPFGYNGLRFQIHSDWSMAEKMDYISTCLAEFFKAKGYKPHFVPIGRHYENELSNSKIFMERSHQQIKKFDRKLEAENALRLSREEVSNLRDYLAVIKSFVRKYAELHSKFGNRPEMDPLENLVKKLPDLGFASDLADYTKGLQAAVKEGTHPKAIRKLKMVYYELQELERKVSPESSSVMDEYAAQLLGKKA